MKRFFIFLSVVSIHIFAYTPSLETLELSKKLSGQMEHLFSKMSPDERRSALPKIDVRLTQLQNSLVGQEDTKSLNRLALIQYLARHIPGLKSFETEDTIYDEIASTIWNHSPDGFDILYTPFDTLNFEKNDPQKKYKTLVNGGYFNKVDGARYHAGILSLAGVRYTPPMFDNPQVTHLFCRQSDGVIRIFDNAQYQESLLEKCQLLFQAGPLVYYRQGNVQEENFYHTSYIGRAHKRTVLVLFEKQEDQDLWFLTINEEVTLSEVKNIVLRELRFINQYDSIYILNLDGGSSVAHMNYAYPEINIGRTKILPIVFGIK